MNFFLKKIFLESSCFFALTLCLAVCLLLMFFSRGAAEEEAGAFLSLSPASGTFLTGSVFTASIFLDTGGRNINTVWAELEFPADKLQVASPLAGRSFIGEWLAPPSYSNQKGVISFQGGIPGGISTSGGLVAEITFRAVSIGPAKILFTDKCRVLLNDGKGTNILTGQAGGQYNIMAPLPEGPAVFSPTHPNPEKWYADKSPLFSWEKEAGATDFSYQLSQSSQSRPDTTSEGEETAVSFEGLEDGLWYFHIRAKKNGLWGKTSTAAIKIDTTPPQVFQPEVKVHSAVFVYFQTADQLSGISHYQIKIVDLANYGLTQTLFTEAGSPFKVLLEKPGKYSAIVQAVDKAGNIQEAEARFSWPPSFLTRFLQNKFILPAAALLLMVGLGVFSWQFFKRKHIPYAFNKK